MDWVFLALIGLTVFLTRDACLLSASPSRRDFSSRLSLYGIVLLAVFAGLGAAAEQISRSEALTLLRDPRSWVPALAVHLMLWVTSERWRTDSRKHPRAWLLALFPAPVFVYGGGGLCWLALRNLNWEGWVAGLVIGAVAVALVMLASMSVRSRKAVPAEAGLGFAGAANLSALLLIAFPHESVSSTVFDPIGGLGSTLMCLGATALLIAGSFAYHRWRSSV